MMFSLMKASNLYPPFYWELREQAQEAVAVTLFNEERPPVWEQVSDWIDRNGPIANADLCQIANADTLKASRMFRRWVEQGILVPVEGRAKRNMVYRKPVQTGMEREASLLSDALDNNDSNE
jgi:ATP-dependent DNA helicase RecG